MKTKLIVIFLVGFYLVSCMREREEKFKKSICGEWKFVRSGFDRDVSNKGKKLRENQEAIPPNILVTLNYRKGYIFYSNNSCVDKRGYYKRIKKENREERHRFFIGTDTKYKVENDSLKIFDLTDSIWRALKIRSITTDTLTLEIENTIFFKYAKTNYKIDNTQTFDKILVSTSACYGSCPISNTSIDKYGNVIFFGQGYNTKSGLFVSRINQDLYRMIELNFKKANIDKLDEKYSSDWTDDQTISVTFIKDDKIYKTISDYGFKAPKELYWAYNPVSYLYQKLDLKSCIVNTLEPLSLIPACFENKGRVCELARSERFYLITELYKGKTLKHEFDKKYILKYWDDKDSLQTILTDGRYYQLGKKDRIITIDLGYNFLTKNNLNKKFRKKNEND